MLVWDGIFWAFEQAQRQLEVQREIEQRQRAANRLRYIAGHLEQLSKILDEGARQLTHRALENQATISAKRATSLNNR